LSKTQKIMRWKTNTNTVNIRHWEQVSFLPKIKHPVAAQVPALSRANEGDASTPGLDRQILSRSIRRANKH